MNLCRLCAAATSFKISIPAKHYLPLIILCQSYNGASWSDDGNINKKPSQVAKHRITKPVTDGSDKEHQGHRVWKQHSSRKQSSKHATYLQDRQKELIRKPKVRGQMIYGKFPIVTALQTRKRTIYQLYLKSNLLEERDDRTADVIDDIINLANDNQIPIEAVSKYILNLLVDDPMQGLRQHQGICADVSPLHYIPVDLGDERSFTREMGQVPKVWLVIQSVQDPNNFGALLRSAYYLGVDRIIAFNSCKLSPAVSKVSAGVLEVLDVYKTDNLQQLLQVCRGYRWQVFGTTGLSSEDQNRILLPEVKIDRDVIVVLGNEGYGLSDDISSLCDKMITIPSRNEQQHTMLANGMLDSLNVSVASGIILHHLVNNRKRS